MDPVPGTAATRSGLYRAFATAFSHPVDDFPDLLLSGEFQAILAAAGSRLQSPLHFGMDELNESLNGVDSQEIIITYSTLFESGSHAVSLRELTYSTLTEKTLMEELFRFYQHFGLEFSRGELRELPDLLPVELEFLHYLTFLEAQASDIDHLQPNISALQAAQRDFIDLHPGRWIDNFIERLKSRANSGLYLSFAAMLRLFLKHERHYLSRSDTELIATDQDLTPVDS